MSTEGLTRHTAALAAGDNLERPYYGVFRKVLTHHIADFEKASVAGHRNLSKRY